jgi:hypothetical protein
VSGTGLAQLPGKEARMNRMAQIAVASCFLGALGCSEPSERTVGFRDEVITANVEAALKAKVPGNIEVNTRERVVTLSGTVPDTAARDRAGDLATRIAGVARVNNNIRATIAADAPARPPAGFPQAPLSPPNPPHPPELK